MSAVCWLVFGTKRMHVCFSNTFIAPLINFRFLLAVNNNLFFDFFPFFQALNFIVQYLVNSIVSKMKRILMKINIKDNKKNIKNDEHFFISLLL